LKGGISILGWDWYLGSRPLSLDLWLIPLKAENFRIKFPIYPKISSYVAW
jgi:hypothetical protein